VNIETQLRDYIDSNITPIDLDDVTTSKVAADSHTRPSRPLISALAFALDAALRPSAGYRGKGVFGRRLLTIAATLLILLLIVGLGLTVGKRSNSTPVDQPVTISVPTIGTDAPTVDYPSDQTWYIPAVLPDDLIFDRAEDRGPTGQNLRYRSESSDRSITVQSGSPLATALKSDQQVDVNGVVWHVATTDSTDSAVWFGAPEGVDLVVSGVGIDDKTMLEVVRSLERRQATDLARPPIPVGGSSSTAVEVATAIQDGVPKRLFADTDGVSFAFNADGGGSGSVRLGSEALVVSSALGPNPNLVSNGQRAESLIWGLVRADVASVDVELTDGNVVTTQPQDESGSFVENFFFVAVPTRTEGGLEMISAIVARDRDGNELGRTDGLFG
jgi:hypothetical protein